MEDVSKRTCDSPGGRWSPPLIIARNTGSVVAALLALTVLGKEGGKSKGANPA